MSHAPTAALERRHQQLREACAARDLDAFVVTALPNVLYLTNFTGSSAILVVTPGGIRFITDFRYVTSIEEKRGGADECPGLELTIVSGSYDEALADALSAYRRVGFEASHLTVSRFDWLRHRLESSVTSELVPTEDIVEHQRLIKDEYEIGTLREAGRRLSAVTKRVLADVRAGLTERQLALRIDTRIREAGFERTAFDTIVAAGPNGALPHARPSERKLVEGDLVVLDFGGVYDSYCVDLTRTVSIGRAGQEARRVYAAVREAHDRAIRTAAPGVAPWEVDAAARGHLEAEGLGEAFGHGTGHGLGIDVHETPRITRRRPDPSTGSGSCDERLAPGMVFTIEPGAYIPSWGGVRIEDDVLVTPAGVELLTDAPTELLEI